MVIVNADDGRLIERTLAGETQAFGELVLRYQDRLYGTLTHLLGSVHDAHDVAQDAFIAAFDKLDTFRQESSFYSWLFRIAYHAAVNNRRKQRRHQHLSVEGQREATGAEPAESRPNDPAAPLESLEDQQRVQEALNELAPEFRDVLIFKELEGLRYEEIAVLLEIPLGTVRSRIHRARHELKEKLSRTPSTG